MMYAVLVALVLLNIATQVLHARREQRLIDALMARNAGEYALIRRSEKPAAKGAKQPEPEAEPTRWVVGLS